MRQSVGGEAYAMNRYDWILLLVVAFGVFVLAAAGMTIVLSGLHT